MAGTSGAAAKRQIEVKKKTAKGKKPATAKTSTKKPAPKKATPAKPKESSSFNMQEIRDLAKLVDTYGFADFEFENENIRIRLSKNVAPQYVTAAPAPQLVSAPVAANAPVAVEHKVETPHPGAKAETEASADEELFKITSPIVGTFYAAPAPDKDPYVQVGSRVSDDTIVCIVEAMKLMNEIQAETSGEVVKIYVENGQPVEYGQPLFGIRK